MITAILWVIVVLVLVLGLSIEWHKWRINKKLHGWIAQYDVPIIGIGGSLIGKSEVEVTRFIDNMFLEPHTVEMPTRFWVGAHLFILISDPEDLKIVLNSGVCIDKPNSYSALNCYYGLGLSQKAQWKNDRRNLNCTFNSNVMARFLPHVDKAAISYCQDLKQTSDGNGDFKSMLMRTLIEQVIATLFDMKYEISLKEATQVFDYIVQIEYFTKRRIQRFWLRWDFIYRLTPAYKEQSNVDNAFRTFLQKLLQHKWNSLDQRFAEEGDVLEEAKANNAVTFIEKILLLAREKKVTDKMISDHLFLLFIASIMTTSTTILASLTLLAIYPEYQAKVVEELQTVFTSKDEAVTFDALAKMTFTEAVLKETLRRFPPVPLISRKCTADLQVKTGIIPKDSVVIISLPKVHRDPKQWGDDADCFRPERFLSENIRGIHPYAFIGFSQGPRNCLGMRYAMISMKVFLSHLLRHYKFSTHLRIEDIRIETNISATLLNEQLFSIEPRQF